MDNEVRTRSPLHTPITRRKMLALGANAGLAAGLAACGVQSNSQSPSSATSAATSATASAPVVSPAPTSPDFSGITIRAQVGFSEVALFEKLGPMWEERTGGKVVADFTAFSERSVKFASIIATQDPTWDIIYGSGTFVGRFGGQLYEPIAPIYGDTSDFVPGALKTLTRDDTLYCIPAFSYVWLYMYNKQLYRDAGLDPERAPTTYAEAYANAAAFARTSASPYAAAWLAGPPFAYWYFLNWMNTTPTQLLSEDRTRIQLDNDDGLAAFQSVLDGHTAGFFDPAANTVASDVDINTLFTQGKTAQIFGGPDMYATVMTPDPEAGIVIRPEDLGVALMPGIAPGTSGTIESHEGLGLSRFGQQREAAMDFINWMTSPDIQLVMMFELGAASLPSSRLSVLTDPDVIAKYPISGLLAEQGATPSSRYDAPYDISPPFDVAVRNMFDGTWDARTARDETQKAGTDIIVKYLSS